ncbi:MAG: hypothetical protein IPH45_09570 [Bacteroidales bacterium]|nr:hypothetical protein [Bacteroidales bacterium]
MTRPTLLTTSITVIILSLFLSSACKHDPELQETVNPPDDTTQNPTSQCSPDTVYFEQQILPMLQSGCAMSGCHDVGTHEEGIVLNSYANIMSTGGINISNPTRSEIYEKMAESDLDDRMPPPPYPAFTSDKLALISKWISQGAKNNSCLEAGCDTTNVTYLTHIKPLLQNHCQGCHSGGNPSGGIPLVIYSDAKAIADNGKFLGTINQLNGYSPMPQNSNKLTDCQINMVKIWINLGAPNN